MNKTRCNLQPPPRPESTVTPLQQHLCSHLPSRVHGHSATTTLLQPPPRPECTVTPLQLHLCSHLPSRVHGHSATTTPLQPPPVPSARSLRYNYTSAATSRPECTVTPLQLHLCSHRRHYYISGGRVTRR